MSAPDGRDSKRLQSFRSGDSRSDNPKIFGESLVGYSRQSSKCSGRKLMIIVIAANRGAPDRSYMKEPTDPVDAPENQHESTYGLLIRSEEKSRNVLEMVIYPLLIIGAIVAIWQFVLQAMELPSMNAKGGSVFQEKRLTAVA